MTKIKIQNKLTITLVVIALFLATATSASAARFVKRFPIWASIKPYVPGEATSLRVFIKNQRRGTYYNLKIHYNGPWWGGGSGPAWSTYGHQYWMECSGGNGCTEWWAGYIPPRKYSDTIVIPLNTSLDWNGEYEGAATISGKINSQPVNISVKARTK